MTGRRERVILYSAIGVLLVVLAAIGMATWRGAQESRAAQEKADRLIAALSELGATAPDRDQIVRVLGTDGGRVCADPSGALNRAAQLGGMSNGAGGPGSRPIVADSRIVQGELAIITIYCPGELSEFQEFVDDLRTAELTNE